jgi:sugar phosphate isomerase/epimerase
LWIKGRDSKPEEAIMKIAYAFRRGTLYPHYGSDLLSREVRKSFFRKAREIGFEGIEVEASTYDISGPIEPAARGLRKELEDSGLLCAAVRSGGGFSQPRVASTNSGRLKDAVRFASWIGASIVNTALVTPPAAPHAPGAGMGEQVSQGSSRTSREEDYEWTAKVLREAASAASDLGVEISVEVHQHSIVDNSWSALHLLELIDRPNVGVNPDLGNIYWTYNVPEETCEAAIVALAPHAKYWHCKNLFRIHIPELNHAIFQQVPLPDGEIDYRFALSAMLDAGFDGYLAIEGLRLGDQWHGDARSVSYIRTLMGELHESGVKRK